MEVGCFSLSDGRLDSKLGGRDVRYLGTNGVSAWRSERSEREGNLTDVGEATQDTAFPLSSAQPVNTPACS
jgi:hypothetical protein